MLVVCFDRAISDAAVARCNTKNAAAALRVVVADGHRDFRGIYDSMWSMIYNNDAAGMAAYVVVSRPYQSLTCF